MNNLSKTIAEVKSALDQATKMLDENQTLRDEIQTLKASPNTHRRQRELKIAQLSFKQGIESVLFQLRENDHETEHSIEESSYDNGFDLTLVRMWRFPYLLAKSLTNIMLRSRKRLLIRCYWMRLLLR